MPDGLEFTEARETFLAAAGSVRELVARVPDVALDGPGLGVWDLRALVGHTSRSIVTVLSYLQRPADVIEIDSAAAYFAAIKGMAGASADDVAERGRQAGRDLGQHPATRFDALCEEVTAALVEVGDGVITCVAGGIRLRDYLPTRTFELAVHGQDIADATGLPFDPPVRVLRSAAVLGAEIAVRLGHATEMLRGLTGRAPLPPGFTVV